MRRHHQTRAALVALAACCALLTGAADAAAVQADDVRATKHNLSASQGGTVPQGVTLVDYGEVCVYCHTPHGGNQPTAPLWNREFSTATYQMYSSPTIDMTIDGQPSGLSLSCLSCHDGTIGLDVIVNPPNTFTDTVPNTVPGFNTMPSGRFANLSTDLRDDHPVSVTYDVGADSAFNSKASVVAAGLRLFGDGTADKVECASCHNPHNNANEPFLRTGNSGSAMCVICHVK